MKDNILQMDTLLDNENSDDKKLDYQIAVQCAPLLTGIKVSNLLIVPAAKRKAVITRFQHTVLSYYLLCTTEQRAIFLIYHQETLLKYLEMDAATKTLHLAGYRTSNLEEILKELSVRYCNHVNHKHTFPHEIGIFLGYPVEDVVAFIKNQGRNYLYIGDWKVYSNLSEALNIFENYRQAKQLVIRMISQGVNVHHIIESSYLA